MRTSTLLVLSLSTAATLVTAEKEGGGGGALQALLERMQTKKQQNQARALGAGHTATRPPPEDYSNGTDSHNSTSSAPHSNKSHHKTIKDSSSSSSSSSSPKSDSASNKHGKKVHHDRPASSSVESSTKSRLRSSDFARRPIASDKKVKEQKASTILERDLRIAESGGRLTKKDFASVKEVETGGSDQAVATDKSSKKVQEKTGKTFGKKEELKKPEDKRWVWGTAILQDDTPAASNVPAVGENANYLNSAPANTPTATLAAPSFPPLAAAETSSSQSSAAALQSKVASRQKIGDRKKAAHAPQPASKEKRWTWGSEIIQDGDENAPPVGENANLLSSGTTIAMNTPVAQLTPPSFPPLVDATTSAEPATETVEALQSNEGEVEGAQAAAQVVEEASSTLSAVAAQMTSGTPNIEALLNKLQEEINALANAYSQVTQGGDAADAAAETSPAENAKRWVWGPSIIQDDTPASAAPPIGQNTNLLNPAVPVETPSNKPLAPSFPARIGLATAPNNLAAAPASVAPVTPPVSSPAEIESAPESTSTTTSRMNRKSYADSVRSARAAALKTKTAAMEWHLVNKKRQVGGMAKQHKRA